MVIVNDFLHPHLCATGAATEGLLASSCGLGVHAADDLARCLGHASDATEVTGVVVSDLTVVLRCGEFSVALEGGNQLAVVQHLDVLAAECLVLLTECVEAMWA